MEGALKLFALNLVLTHPLNFFIVTKRIWLAPFLQMKVFAVNSADGSFCLNYATDTFYGNYAGDNVCCIYAGFEVMLFVTGMLVDSAAHIQETVSVANMWVKIFVVIMQMRVSFSDKPMKGGDILDF